MSNVSISSIEDRTIELACYIIENKATIRAAADCIGISKSVAHSDLLYRLPYLNPPLFEEVRTVLNWNFAERQIRGGHATQKVLARRKNKAKEAAG